MAKRQKTPNRCTAKTKAGKRCSRRAVKKARCAQHPPQKPGPRKGNGGRPRAQWNKREWKIFDAMCACGALEEDIAVALDVCRDTINTICKRDRGLTFSAYRTQKKGKGRVSLAAKQLEVALNGNVVMLIWLGKQWLDQKEPPKEFEHSGKKGAPIHVVNEGISERTAEDIRAKVLGITDADGEPETT